MFKKHSKRPKSLCLHTLREKQARFWFSVWKIISNFGMKIQIYCSNFLVKVDKNWRFSLLYFATWRPPFPCFHTNIIKDLAETKKQALQRMRGSPFFPIAKPCDPKKLQSQARKATIKASMKIMNYIIKSIPALI